MREGLAYLSFTDRGQALAEKLSAALGGVTARAGGDLSIGTWTENAFRDRSALVFVGAAGIAVRAIAPFLRHKSEDPAVLSVDETGHYVIPLLSGHLGGANAMALKIAAITGGEAVITTATDLNGVFAVDLWAAHQNMKVRQLERIKMVSSKLLAGRKILLDCRWEIRGERPENVEINSEAGKKRNNKLYSTDMSKADVLVSYRSFESSSLQLIPRILTLGIGCRKGTGDEALEEGFERFCRERRILPEAIRSASSIDCKSGEEGLIHFCRSHGWPVRFYAAEELGRAEGCFTGSDFVRSAVGVDNVCERAAVLESGGTLAEKKYAGNGITFALAECETEFDWSW